jgi:predicted DNA binding CopG/RHH family protein
MARYVYGRNWPISSRLASKKERRLYEEVRKALKIEFDSKEIIEGMSRLKGARRKPTSIALEEKLLMELKTIASKRGVPYQVLMRLLIAEGVKRMKDAA